jgi:hypothetical protein
MAEVVIFLSILVLDSLLQMRNHSNNAQLVAPSEVLEQTKVPLTSLKPMWRKAAPIESSCEAVIICVNPSCYHS